MFTLLFIVGYSTLPFMKITLHYIYHHLKICPSQHTEQKGQNVGKIPRNTNVTTNLSLQLFLPSGKGGENTKSFGDLTVFSSVFSSLKTLDNPIEEAKFKIHILTIS